MWTWTSNLCHTSSVTFKLGAGDRHHELCGIIGLIQWSLGSKKYSVPLHLTEDVKTLVRMTVTALEQFTTPANPKLSPETLASDRVPLLYLRLLTAWEGDGLRSARFSD